jgi:surface protein
MATLQDLQTKRDELNSAIVAYTQAVQAGVQIDITTTKAAAQAKGDEYAKLISQVKQDDPAVTNDDQLFSRPAAMNALARQDVATIMTTGRMFGAGMKLLVDTEGNASGATNVILSFAAGSDVTIDWGDGTGYQAYTGAASHNYATPGQYTVEVHGTVNGFTTALSENRQQIKDVMQWGLLEFASTAMMFQQRLGFVISASDGPTILPGASCAQMFYNANDFNSNIDHWDMGNVVNMYYMFSFATNFNQPLNGWNVSNVTDMAGMFFNTLGFNRPIGNWDVSNVTDMSRMFYKANAFNQALNAWNVGSVTNMLFMFRDATNFNQPLNGWNVSNVTVMSDMFNQADAFNQPLYLWDVSSVTSMPYMFANADSFNQNLSGWNVSQVTSYTGFNVNSALVAGNVPNF